MPLDAFIEKSSLLLIGLYWCYTSVGELKGKNIWLTVGKTLAISWLPVTDRAKSTTMARRALGMVESIISQTLKILVGIAENHPLAGSHMRLTTLSRVSTPPSFRALVTDFAPCSLVANSRRPSKRWLRVMLLWVSDPCSKTIQHQLNWWYVHEHTDMTHYVECSMSPIGSWLPRWKHQIHD